MGCTYVIRIIQTSDIWLPFPLTTDSLKATGITVMGHCRLLKIKIQQK